MKQVVEKIISMIDISQLVDPVYRGVFHKKFEQCITDTINGMPDNEELLGQCNRLKEIENRVKSIERGSECVTCCDDTKNHVMFTRCKHVVCVCKKCEGLLKHECVLCMTQSNIIYNCFVV
jgi:hypothetical protein